MRGIPVLLKALYFKDIESIRKMLANQTKLCCVIEPTRILSRTPGINKSLTSLWARSDSPIVDCSLIDREIFYCTNDPIEPMGDRLNRSIPDSFNQALPTAVNHCEVHHINTIMFGCYRGQKKLAPEGKANNQKFVQMSQAAKTSSFTAKRRSSGALTTPLKIKFFAVLSQKMAIQASPFLSGGGVPKHQ